MEPGSTLGNEFAEALARKDYERIGELLDPEVDFRALTPNRNWEAHGAAAVIGEVLSQWFEESDRLDELVEVESARVSDRERVAYLLRGVDDEGPFVVEQQAYYTERDGRIDWMRVLCSGFRPA